MQVYTSAPYVLSTCAVELLDKKLDEHAAAVRERALGSRSVAEYCKRQDLDFCIAIPLEDLRKIKQTYVHRVCNEDPIFGAHCARMHTHAETGTLPSTLLVSME